VTDSSSQRRRWLRVPVNYSALVRKVSDGTLGRLGQLKTLGLGGCLVVMDRGFPMGDILKLRLMLRGLTVEVTARVAYAVEKEPGEFHNGMEFLDLSPTDWAGIQKNLNLERS
jgi:hypothetical protein